MISTVAVGTDGTQTAAVAVREAADIAARFGAKLVLLSAFRDDRAAATDSVGEDVESGWSISSGARVHATLERAQAEFGAEGIECEVLADDGEPAQVLVRLAERCKADLLVIGNKGMQRRVLGSVPNTVTHKAGCSVLVVKTS